MILFQATANANDLHARIFQLIDEVYAYPQIISLNIEPTIRKTSDAYSTVQRLIEHGLAQVVDESSTKISWQPVQGTEAIIRSNVDIYYNLLDYSIILAQIYPEILSITRLPDYRVSVEVNKIIIFEDVFPYLESSLSKQIKKKINPEVFTLRLLEQSDGILQIIDWRAPLISDVIYYKSHSRWYAYPYYLYGMDPDITLFGRKDLSLGRD